ncbi:MAG: PQQ-binding-like beta-propeller repeat protein [Desulfobacterales bacterium]|nr:PQQ-binding-like beta-propeller repeat protein [Desulfobacterales bacterium]
MAIKKDMKRLIHPNSKCTFSLLPKQQHLGPAGNVLVYVVVLMLIFGVLGVAMVSLFSTSMASTANRNDSRRARYLSESGVRYAILEMRAADFDEDNIIDPLNTLTYTVTDAGTFKPNIFTPWFDSDADVDAPDVVYATPRLGEIPVDFTTDPASPLNDVWLINYDYITGTGPDILTMRDEAYSLAISGTSQEIDIAGSSFLALTGEQLVLGVEPTEDRTINEGGSLYVARDARHFFPKFNGAININRVDYAYARLVDDGSKVILENVTASQFPPPTPPLSAFPLTVDADSGGTYDGDFVILSPRNYMVMAEGESDGVAVGDSYALGMNVYNDSLIPPESRKPDITSEDFVSNLRQQETDSRFFDPNLTDFELDIGGGGTDEFGSAFYDATRDFGGERDYCEQGACLFAIGIRTYFLLDFSSQGDGITFTLLNAADNTASSAGGDVDLSELIGYAGDSRTNSAGTAFLATDAADRGLDPPKIAVEFDTRTNNDTLAYCNGGSVNQNTRDDPLDSNQDAVQYVFWGREANVAQPCRDDPSYDDNRHGPGLWQFDAPSGRIDSSAGVDPSTGTIYIGSNDNNVYAINPDGTQKWVFTGASGDIISSPAVDPNDGTVYVGSNDNNVYAINPATGNQKWVFATGGDVRSSPAIASDGTIYVASNDGVLYALNSAQRQSGAPFPAAGEWQRPNPVNPGAEYSLGRPAIGPAPNRTIYVSDRVNTLFAVRPSDGAVLWTFNTVDASEYMPGVDSSSGVIYTDVFGNSLVAVNTGGSERWRLGVGSDIDSTPVVGSDGTVYIGTDARDALLAIREINPSLGQIIWEFPAGGDVNIIPALSLDESVVYAISNGIDNADGFVYAVDAATGTENWSFELVTETGQPPGNVTSSPVVDPTTGNIYVGSDDTNVYALTPFDEEPRNEQSLLLTSADLGGTVDSAVNWLNGASTKGPWAVRLEVDRTTQVGGEGDYELRLWMKQCDNPACDTLNGADDPFFSDTRIIYEVSPPDLEQIFQLDALNNAKFDRFLFGFTAAAGAQAQNVSIANFTQSFSRPGDSVITP